MSCALMRQSQSLITNFYRGMTFTNGNGNVIGVISIRTLYYPGHIKMDIMNKCIYGSFAPKWTYVFSPHVSVGFCGPVLTRSRRRRCCSSHCFKATRSQSRGEVSLMAFYRTGLSQDAAQELLPGLPRDLIYLRPVFWFGHWFGNFRTDPQ